MSKKIRIHPLILSEILIIKESRNLADQGRFDDNLDFSLESK